MTLWSLFTGIVCFTLAVIFLLVLRYRTKVFFRVGINLFLIASSLLLIRILLPVDNPRAYVIHSNDVLTFMYRVFDYLLLFGFPARDTLRFLWVAGGVITASYYIYRNGKALWDIQGCPTYSTPQIDRISEELGLPLGLVSINPLAPVPMVVGIFRKDIYLTTQDLTDDQMYWVLLHESSHMKTHDGIIKIVFLMVKCFLWWNPFVWILQNELNTMLEFRCDYAVLKDRSRHERGRYIAALYAIAISGNENLTSQISITPFIHKRNEDDSLLLQRAIAIRDLKTPSRKVSICSIILMMALFIGSYCVIFQPDFASPEVESNEGIIISPENSYIVHEADDTYTLWIDDEYMWDVPEALLDAEPHSKLEIREGSD